MTTPEILEEIKRTQAQRRCNYGLNAEPTDAHLEKKHLKKLDDLKSLLKKSQP